MKNKIVILGHDYSALLCMANSLGSLDDELIILKRVKKESKLKRIIKRIIIGKPIELTNKYVKKMLYIEKTNDEHDRQTIINLLLKEFSNNNETKPILVPTSDYMASTIDINLDILNKIFICPNIKNQQGEIVKYMDKELQKEIAIKNGLNTAKQYNIAYKDEKYIIPKEIEYPVFVKPKVSYLGNKLMIKKCNNQEELTEWLNKLGKNAPIIIEENINIENEYALLGYSYKGKIAMPGLIKVKKSGSFSNCKGVTIIGEVQPFNKESDLYKKIEKFISSIDLNGMFDIDLYEANNKFYFNELNLRFGASGYAITKSGINLPTIYINEINNKHNNYQELKKITVFTSDKTNLDNYEFGNNDWKDYLKAYDNTDFRFIVSKDNKKTNFSFKRLEIYTKVKKTMSK